MTTKPVSPIFLRSRRPGFGFSEFATDIRIAGHEWHRLLYVLIKIAILLAVLGVLFLGTARAGQLLDVTTTTVMAPPEPGVMAAIIEPESLKPPTCTVTATTTTRAIPVVGPYKTITGPVIVHADPAKWDIQHFDYVLAQLVAENFEHTGLNLPDYVRDIRIDCPLNGVTLTVKVTTAK